MGADQNNIWRKMGDAAEAEKPHSLDGEEAEAIGAIRMTIFDLIRAEKTNVSIGKWCDGKIPASSFPINRPRGMPTGGDWRWRLCEFDAAGHHCRVLIRLNTERQRYHAILAVDVGRTVRILCHHELHIGDKGWHCHFATGNIDGVLQGVLRDRDTYRVVERPWNSAGSVSFTVDKDNALTKAAQRYRFEAKGGLV